MIQFIILCLECFTSVVRNVEKGLNIKSRNLLISCLSKFSFERELIKSSS